MSSSFIYPMSLVKTRKRKKIQTPNPLPDFFGMIRLEDQFPKRVLYTRWTPIFPLENHDLAFEVEREPIGGRQQGV